MEVVDTGKYVIKIIDDPKDNFADNSKQYFADKNKLTFQKDYLFFDKMVVSLDSLNKTVKIFINEHDVTEDIITKYNKNVEKTIEEINEEKAIM